MFIERRLRRNCSKASSMEHPAVGSSPEELCQQPPPAPESPTVQQLPRRSSQPSNGQTNGAMPSTCYYGTDAANSFIPRSYVAGSLRDVHQACLQRWVESPDTRRCELCKFSFIVRAEVKWGKLEMSSVEQRKVLCPVAFHVVAITCVVRSLYVLLIAVAIGFSGDLVFTCVQCKSTHCAWRAVRTIQIQDALALDKGAALPTAIDLSPLVVVQVWQAAGAFSSS
ncbi:hypothetical protein HPB48_020454 [Haemaphysalis longicornis]|uniref:RING-CH-type domain-containing protein n=1 Tax=Haemaphysalis longicornis TaxID=44386 RepID=A0A9J6FMR3_HAELO|nr:hypothetical protein HPB48_020454 [Haemaphysalis longicornis]